MEISFTNCRGLRAFRTIIYLNDLLGAPEISLHDQVGILKMIVSVRVHLFFFFFIRTSNFGAEAERS